MIERYIKYFIRILHVGQIREGKMAALFLYKCTKKGPGLQNGSLVVLLFPTVRMYIFKINIIYIYMKLYTRK